MNQTQSDIKPGSFRTYAWKQFRRNKPALVAFYILIFLLAIAIMAPILANDKPLYISYKGHSLFPALTFKKNYVLTNPDGNTEKIQIDIADWKHMDADKVIWAPVPYAAGKTDMLNAGYKGPHDEQLFTDNKGGVIPMPERFRHKLGTNSLGEDILAGLIHGTRISLTIGCISMTIAALIGLLLGALAGYYGDSRWHTRRGTFWMGIIGIIFAWFYGWQQRQFDLQDGLKTSGTAILLQLFISIVISIIVVSIFVFIGRLISKLPWLNKSVEVPVDSMISRSIEILHAMPTFVLILTVAAIARPSLINVMIIIGLTSWTGIARLTRAEFLRIREMEYVQAARALGLKDVQVILKHALPNGIAPALVSIAFGIASAILIESSLSFLGIGVPADIVTWGSLVNDGRQQYSAWWLVVFPGLAIFVTVTVYNLIGEGLRDALDPRQKK